MKLLILAAGYATRLYPLTLTQPKPLLPVAGKPMIEYVLGHLQGIPEIDHVYVVTNAKFAAQFERWSATYPKATQATEITIVNDGSTDDTNKLGAIGDIDFVLRREQIDDDLIVVAGDNLFSRPLNGFGETCRQRQAAVLGVYDVGKLEQVKRYAMVETDAVGKIVRFEEKPPHPSSTLIGIALYFYPRAVLPLIRRYVDAGNNTDQPGRLIQWLYPQTPIYAWTVPGIWYDIGSKETLEEANRIFARRKE